MWGVSCVSPSWYLGLSCAIFSCWYDSSGALLCTFSYGLRNGKHKWVSWSKINTKHSPSPSIIPRSTSVLKKRVFFSVPPGLLSPHLTSCISACVFSLYFAILAKIFTMLLVSVLLLELYSCQNVENPLRNYSFFLHQNSDYTKLYH